MNKLLEIYQKEIHDILQQLYKLQQLQQEQNYE